MERKKIANLAPALFIFLLALYYLNIFTGLIGPYFFYISVFILIAEALSILFSDYATMVSSIPYIMIVSMKSPLIVHPSIQLIITMILVSMLFIPSRIFLQNGNISAFVSFFSISLTFYFMNFSIYSHYLLYLFFIIMISLVSYFLSRKSDSFFLYLITFFLIVSLISTPKNILNGLLNMKFSSSLALALQWLLPLSLIVFLQDLLYDRTVPYIGIVLSGFVLIILRLLPLSYILIIILVMAVTLILPLIMDKFSKSHEADYSFYGVALLSIIKYYSIDSQIFLLILFLSFAIFYIIIKRLKNSNK